MTKALTRIILVFLAVLISGPAMAATIVKKINAVKLTQASSELSEAELLDISIIVFDPGIPEDPEKQQKKNIFPKVREAEARYIPYVLRSTIESSNLWGAVRMVPAPDPLSELIISGKILRSNGTELAIQVEVHDALGERWFRRNYESIASKFSYRDDLNIPGDPFQDIYNAVANDLYAYRQKMDREELERIRTVASLRYAAELSPDAFGSHLETDKKGRPKINRLPSEDDPMLDRVNRIKESEYLFIDTLDQQYARFHRQMNPSYDSWRQFTYEETKAVKELKSSSRRRMAAGLATVLAGAAASQSGNSRITQAIGQTAALGGISAVKHGYDVGKQAQIHENALQELAASFNAEMEPIVVEVEGEIIKLNGSLESQYQEWRQILRRIYSEETGLSPETGNREEFGSNSLP